MEQPIKSNGYEKYIIQIGWWKPAPDLMFAVLAQEVLSQTYSDAKLLMKFLYPQSLGLNFPYLCPITQEISNEETEKEQELIDKWLRGEFKKIDLIYPN